MNLYRRIKSAWFYASHLPWSDAGLWDAENAAELQQFLRTPTGIRLKASMINLVLRQQERALSDPREIVYEAGFAAGQKAMLTHIAESWPNAFTESEGAGAAPTTDHEHQYTAEEPVTIL
mgnify:CR=1 FL=1|jgi:hypothetical protein